MNLCRRLPSAFALLLALAAPAQADKRVALVVGNSAYVNVPRLDNPRNDARLMADTLRGLGFTVVGNAAQVDLDKAGLDVAVQSFGRQIQGADVALFYYAGHGVQVAGSNYLVPVNANPTREADVGFQMLDMNLVLQQMQGSGTKLNLVILDACRNNPFGGRGLRATDGGLAQMRAPTGTLISYATQPGNVAQDGADGNSPYTKALAATIRKPGLGIFEAFNEVGLAVQRTTGGAQQPWVSNSPIDGSFYFAAAPAQTFAATPRADPCAAADMHWRSAEAIGTASAFQDHLARFPNCAFAGLAKARIDQLEAQRQAAPPTPPRAQPDPEPIPSGSLRPGLVGGLLGGLLGSETPLPPMQQQAVVTPSPAAPVPRAIDISIPEGLTSEQVVARLLETKELSGNIREIPAEGSLLPDTYRVAAGSAREDVLARMRDAQRQLVDNVWGRRSPDLPLKNASELVILASIVETEAGKPDERPRIAAVLVNRLKQKMKLQVDSTVVYGLVGGRGSLGRPLARTDLTQLTPYNTYLSDGLPPGPIANPSRTSLEAAALPARTKDIYFAPDGSGGHLFAEKNADHQKNLARLRASPASPTSAPPGGSPTRTGTR
jgi:uncharacterized caspase-like protein